MWGSTCPKTFSGAIVMVVAGTGIGHSIDITITTIMAIVTSMGDSLMTRRPFVPLTPRVYTGHLWSQNVCRISQSVHRKSQSVHWESDLHLPGKWRKWSLLFVPPPPPHGPQLQLSSANLNAARKSRAVELNFLRDLCKQNKNIKQGPRAIK